MAGRRDEVTSDQFRKVSGGLGGIRGLAFSAGNCMNSAPYGVYPSTWY